MAYLQGKTPISFLQELCTKRGVTPQYDLIANEGAVHEPTFVFKVTAGEIQGTGKGASKKKAKHNAALMVLNQMLGGTNGAIPHMEDFSQLATEDSDKNDEVNPVGELQEMTQKRLLPPPVYDYTSEQGPPHAREFVCNVRLLNLAEQGVGKSKKLAKRNASLAMLKLIRQGGPVTVPPGEQQEEYDDENIPLPLDPTKSAYSCLKEGKKIQTLTPQASHQVSQFYHTIKNTKGQRLISLQNRALNAPSLDYQNILKEIAEEQKFDVTYVDLPEPSQSGQMQCLVQLSTLPVAVCHGIGSTSDEAHSQAAHNALQYLKIMTKQ